MGAIYSFKVVMVEVKEHGLMVKESDKSGPCLNSFEKGVVPTC